MNRGAVHRDSFITFAHYKHCIDCKLGIRVYRDPRPAESFKSCTFDRHIVAADG